MKRLNELPILLLVLSLWLTACGSSEGGPVLSDIRIDSPTLNIGEGRAINLSYQVGRDTKVSAAVQGPDGKRYDLRKDEPRTPGSYNLRFDGAVEFVENNLTQRRILPDGGYKFVLEAQGSEAQGLGFSLNNSPAKLGYPEVESIATTPQVISPNFDARDDVATFNWRTTRSATVTISLAGANSFNRVLKTAKNQPAQEDRVDFNGLDQKGDPLPDGIYNYTIQAADQYGNITRRGGQVEVQGGGRPEATITFASISPTEIIRGNTVTVTVRVKNTGKVPIRTQGPFSNFQYTTRDTYSSIENNRYDDKAGFWRIGVDYDANSGVGGPVRYPFRWGFGKISDGKGEEGQLLPGEEAEVVGQIKIDRDEKDIRLYVGLIQEKIALVQDRRQITTVKITY